MIDFISIYMYGLTPEITSAKVALSYTSLLPKGLKYSSSVQEFFVCLFVCFNGALDEVHTSAKVI